MSGQTLSTKETLTRFAKLEQEIAAERGDFTLFALVRPEEGAQSQWDLVVAAPWEKDRIALRVYVVDQIQKRLGAETFLTVPRIVSVPEDHPLTQELLAEYPIEHGRVRVEENTFLGLPITQAYIITARPTAPAVAA